MTVYRNKAAFLGSKSIVTYLPLTTLIRTAELSEANSIKSELGITRTSHIFPAWICEDKMFCPCNLAHLPHRML